MEWAVIRRAGTAKEGGTAEPPPAAFVPPAMSAGGRRPPDDPQEGHPTMPHPDNTRHFPALPAAIDLPAMEHEMLRRWQDGKVFERSLEQTAAGPLWTFYAVSYTHLTLPTKA